MLITLVLSYIVLECIGMGMCEAILTMCMCYILVNLKNKDSSGLCQITWVQGPTHEAIL